MTGTSLTCAGVKRRAGEGACERASSTRSGRSWRGPAIACSNVIQQTLPDVIVAGDSTQPVYSGNHLFEATHPLVVQLVHGLRHARLRPARRHRRETRRAQRPVVCLIGDGGIQFTLPELASAVEANTPIIVLLWNNHGYGEIKRYMLNRSIQLIGVDIYTPDLLALAERLRLQRRARRQISITCATCSQTAASAEAPDGDRSARRRAVPQLLIKPSSMHDKLFINGRLVLARRPRHVARHQSRDGRKDR